MAEFPLIVTRDMPKRAYREGRWLTVARAVPGTGQDTSEAAAELARVLYFGDPVVEGSKVVFGNPVDHYSHMGAVLGIEQRFGILFNKRFGPSFFGVRESEEDPLMFVKGGVKYAFDIEPADTAMGVTAVEMFLSLDDGLFESLGFFVSRYMARRHAANLVMAQESRGIDMARSREAWSSNGQAFMMDTHYGDIKVDLRVGLSGGKWAAIARVKGTPKDGSYTIGEDYRSADLAKKAAEDFAVKVRSKFGGRYRAGRSGSFKGELVQEQNGYRAALNKEWQQKLHDLMPEIANASEDELLDIMAARWEIQGGDAKTRALMDKFDRAFHARQRQLASRRGHGESARENMYWAIKAEVRSQLARGRVSGRPSGHRAGEATDWDAMDAAAKRAGFRKPSPASWTIDDREADFWKSPIGKASVSIAQDRDRLTFIVMDRIGGTKTGKVPIDPSFFAKAKRMYDQAIRVAGRIPIPYFGPESERPSGHRAPELASAGYVPPKHRKAGFEVYDAKGNYHGFTEDQEEAEDYARYEVGPGAKVVDAKNRKKVLFVAESIREAGGQDVENLKGIQVAVQRALDMVNGTGSMQKAVGVIMANALPKARKTGVNTWVKRLENAAAYAASDKAYMAESELRKMLTEMNLQVAHYSKRASASYKEGTEYQAGPRRFDTLEEAVKYGTLNDLYEVSVVVDGKTVSSHRIKHDDEME